jgi:hypothetical protein
VVAALVDSGGDRTTFPLEMLGRADFFSVFTVTFEEGRGRVFHLDV